MSGVGTHCSGSLTSGCGLEWRFGRVMLRYLYLDSLGDSDLEMGARKAYGK